MAGPASPGGEGPNFAPPPLPPGWIAQWDASSKKYYFVQLSTGASQWETPTDAAPVGTPPASTPASRVDHPYGVPGSNGNGSAAPAEIIVHPDGSQTARYPDGRLEPVNPREDGTTLDGTTLDGTTLDGTRGIGGGVGGGAGDGERSLGSFLGSTLSSLSGTQHGGGSHGGGVGGLAGQVVTGLLSGGHSGGHGGSGASGIGGKLASQLASNLFSSGNKPPQPQNYHGGQSAGHHASAGGIGGIVGGVASMFSNKPHGSNNGFGYSNSGQTGGYSAPAPPVSYQPPSQPGQPTSVPSYQGGAPFHPTTSGQPQHQTPHAPYSQSTPNQPYAPSYSAPGGHQPPHNLSFPPPPAAQSQPYPGQPTYSTPHGGAAPQHTAPQHTYGAPPPSAPPYSQPQYVQPQYAATGAAASYLQGHPAAAAGGHSAYPAQPQYAASGAPAHHQAYGGGVMGQYH
ncbi:uncharacterized protein THITE_2123926 [Thermothielavioides terrestris NRRL 8126]|uniref:WW domain-containing protein n=1 Tax=Thermothielavioides terrestris (strain ATCC 38088 / NRRL 8126) TaxID=578455 RepID=G2RI34_THETT|nr:uncharacterized protein THITE_2123926 [Thermothielavioides terrestris NRRL 8126]AEO71496.1 hypothetical protein THITE_2123926 [Thermothielavioides terrestris NRRL 8126]